ncbi:MAG: DUF418 domain-containing protein [Edaphobacter sp.]
MNTVQASFVAPLNEELAGPASTIAPVSRFERISNIDVLRGIALLGILVLNIDDFGNPGLLHDIPIGTPINNFASPHVHLNLALLLIKWMFFEGKMRGLFSMLFGAGVILLTSRAERRGSTNVADIYTRRNLLLLFFGVLHACFIWHGDILFDYGFQALLFLYPARNLKAKTLLWLGTILSLVLAPISAFLFLGALQDFSLRDKAAAIQAQQKAGITITAEQKELLHQWHDRVESQRMTPEKTREAVQQATLSYPASVLARAQDGFQGGFYAFHIDLIADTLSAMLLGMGLMKLGFFTGELSYASYWLTALIGFGISVPIYAVGILKAYSSGFYFLEMEKWVWLPYYLTREAGSLAIAAVVILIIRSGLFKAPLRRIEAVGRTAFSNYILTSLICQTVFIWGPWKLYGKLEYYQLMYVVFGVWAINLIVSPLWLKRYAFGPLEWLWRSLTYGVMQPMRLKTEL